ncbi:MAG: IS110 family transposase [Gammaproteobacteria bacterium]
MGQKWLMHCSQFKPKIMKKQTGSFLGIDVSKLWFDISLMAVVNFQKQQMITERFNNNSKGLGLLKKWLKEHKVKFNNDTLLVIENTGIYHRLLWQFFNENNMPIHIGNAAHIKKSFGIARGKNDKIDSQRLCNYAYKNDDELKASATLNPEFLKLKDLITSRTRLISQQTANKTYLKELKNINDEATQKMMEKVYKTAMEGLKKSIKEIDKQIALVIKSDPSIKTNYNLLRSVPGIGPVIATYIVCCTNNFANKVSGKQLACYAGLAPFSDTSGKSLKGRNKVHKMANKELKSLLHMGALSSIKYYQEFRNYYDRKVNEGKHPNAVLNAVFNKIVLRAAAVVNNQEKYVENYKKAA